MSKKPNVGDISYSLNIDQFKNIFMYSNLKFVFYTILITLISFYYLYSLRIQEFKSGKFLDIHLENYFSYLSNELWKGYKPIQLQFFDNHKAIGLSLGSYVLLILLISISYLYLLKGLIQNNMYDIIFTNIQLNPNVNPYSNPNVITKINDSVSSDVYKQYSYFVLLSILLILPILIEKIIHFMDFTKFDIQKNKLLSFSIAFIIFFPPLFILIRSFINPTDFNVLLKGDKFLQTKDFPFIQKLNQDFQNQFYTLYFPIFLLFIFFSLFSILTFHIHKNKFVFYLSFFVLFIFIPLISSFVSTYFVFRDYNESVICELKGYSKNVEISIRNGIHNLYQAIIKYNYPCFRK